ncbi:hypothetical protein GCM10027591_07730 [Zhihengliuella somnathii]
MEQEVSSGSEAAARKSRKPLWLALAAVVVVSVAFAGGFAAGIGSIEPQNTEEYKELMADRNGVAAQLQAAESERDQLQSSIEASESEIAETEAALEKREGELEDAEAAVAEREEAVTAAEEEAEANTIRGGTWTVGTDIAAGTYRADEPVGSDCYWAIYRSGSNSRDIIANDIPGGGRPSVTISEGQDFNSSRCGSWSKQ